MQYNIGALQKVLGKLESSFSQLIQPVECRPTVQVATVHMERTTCLENKKPSQLKAEMTCRERFLITYLNTGPQDKHCWNFPLCEPILPFSHCSILS